MSWSEPEGRVTRAFNDWFLVDRDQRAFLMLGFRFSNEAYQRLWTETGSEPGDPDGPDLVDSFDDKVHGLWPHDYEWMHAAAVLRDSVTAFEVYLEKVREEVLEHHGHPGQVADRSPRWETLRTFFGKFQLDIDGAGIRQIRDLRHFLTHRRGELRTEKLREQFAAKVEGMPPILVELTEDRVVAAMDTLANAVRATDAVAYEHTWGGARIEGLEP